MTEEKPTRRIYKNPPVIEALCEFQFVPDQPWDWTIPGLFYREVEAEFPIKRPFNPFQVEVSAGMQVASVQNIVSNVERMQFVREDEGALIQIGPNILAVNHLRPYSGWEAFKQMVGHALDAYREVASPQAIGRIGLRYINRLEFPGLQSVEIGRFLLAAPAVPSTMPQTFNSWLQRVEIPFEQANGLLALYSGSVPGDTEQSVAFLLDLDFITLQAELVKLDSAMEWVERAHDEVEKVFEACITDEARKLLGEVGHE